MERNNVRAQGILGREVIALKDGSFIGKIQSVAIDSANKKVTGLYVKLKGILSGKNFIPFNSIQAFGSHTVTIKEDYEGETGSKNVAEEKDIIDVPVITINGTMLGKVDDFMFDRSDGAITEYILTEGLVQDTLRGKAALNGAKISRIGKDVIVALGEVDETGLEELDPLYEELGADVVESFAEGKEALEDTMEDFNEEIDEKKRKRKRLGSKR